MESLLAQAGCTVDASSGGLVQPIHMATTFERDIDGGYSRNFSYARFGNPNRAELEALLCKLEGAECGFAFSSGMAAASALLQSLEPGSTVVLPLDVYHGVRPLIESVPGNTLSPVYIDYSDDNQVTEALSQSPALVWLETPSNPMFKITDIARICSLCQRANIPVVADGTWTTPLLQQPIALGADIVLHSLTKYISGHSDILGGALLFARSSKMSEDVKRIQSVAGSVMDPFSCWLTLRGMRTLALRMQRHCAGALQVAEFLSQHPRVSRVYYPWLGLDESQTHIARSQMKAGGGMISFEAGQTDVDAKRIVSKVQMIKRATSLGSTESLIEHRRSSEGDSSVAPPTLIRLSVGLENPADIIDDLRQALV